MGASISRTTHDERGPSELSRFEGWKHGSERSDTSRRRYSYQGSGSHGPWKRASYRNCAATGKAARRSASE